MKYRVKREIKITVYDYVNADTKEQAQEIVDDTFVSLASEISRTGMMDRHSCVGYSQYNEEIE